MPSLKRALLVEDLTAEADEKCMPDGCAVCELRLAITRKVAMDEKKGKLSTEVARDDEDI